MDNTEKIINEFESQVKSFTLACTSDEQFKECCEAVLELLKEQQKTIERLERDLAITQDNLNFYLNGNE